MSAAALAIAARRIQRVKIGDDGNTFALVDVAQRIHHDLGIQRIERSDRLVGKQHLRLLHQGAGDPLSPAVGLSAYRIVQEALTNTLRHAGPDACVLVTVGHDADALTVEVLDDGGGHPHREPAAADGGHGLIGMRERAAVFGGEVRAGPQRGGGFAVCARLPLDASSRR